jgi:hypothetical protein
VIALIQTAALVYGTWTIHQTRPVALAFINTSFMTISANSELGKGLKERIKALKTNQLFYVFNDQVPKKVLVVEQFYDYSNHAEKVPKIKTPFITADLKSGNLKVNIDPLMSNTRFIVIDKTSGQIINYFNN